MSNKKTLIIADDEPTIRLLVTSILGKSYNMITAANGQEVLDIVSRNRPDLVLMDIMMPTMDGYSACASLKKDPETADIPVVMLTGVGHELNKVLAEQMGAEGYITKPFSAEDLKEMVKKHLSAAEASHK
jgi:two-component system alkaline phosphatase synthesis response regulator PhoP